MERNLGSDRLRLRPTAKLRRNGCDSGPNERGLYCCEDGINPFTEVRTACLGFVIGSASLVGFANSSHGS